jgi:hypothetical protein
MTIFIGKVRATDKSALEVISGPDDFVRKIVGAWQQSDIDHRFKNAVRFKRAVRRNRKTLDSPTTIRELFKSSNYLFSTQAEGRRETLYFTDRTKRTGRLRQQHREGPLVEVDKKPKTHRFLSKIRFEFVKEWHDTHKDYLPRFYPYENRQKNGKHHIEFAPWHESDGTVIARKRDRDLDSRIARALREILGIDDK